MSTASESERLAGALDVVADVEGELALHFRVNDERYVIPAADVLKVTELLPINRLPRVPTAVHGIAHHRGRIVTVFDFSALLFGDRRAAEGRQARILVLDRGAKNVGIVVDGVDEIAPIAMGAARAGAHPAVGVLAHRGRAVNVILTDRLHATMLELGADTHSGR